MAKNVNHVTSAKGDNVRGPLLYNPSLDVEVTAATDFSTGGWVKLGYGSTDGVSVEQTADDTTKSVWGASLGTVYSNFQDQITLHCASFMDPDMLGVVFGSGNVSTDATTGMTTIKVKNRNGSQGTFVVAATADNGAPMMWVYRGQTDPNVSYDASEDDIITYDLTVTGISADDGTTSTMIFKTAEPVTKPSGDSGSGK